MLRSLLMLAVQPLSQAPSKLPPMQDTRAILWMHRSASCCSSLLPKPQMTFSKVDSLQGFQNSPLFVMTPNQFTEILYI